VTVLSILDHPLARTRRRERLQALAATAAGLLAAGKRPRDVQRMFTPLSASELAEAVIYLAVLR